jgi:microcin C transport system substrate-binding protein
MQSFAFNARRTFFQDPRVRRAITYAFDFEWSNRYLFFDAYARTTSFFANSDLASEGLPEGEELAVLEKFRGRIPEQVFTEPYALPVYDGTGHIRSGLRTALDLLQEAGWDIVDGRLQHLETGRPLAFELLLSDPSMERIAAPFARNLARLGIAMRIRVVDTAQYRARVDGFDFDMTVQSWGQSLSPGNEQRDFWSSAEADRPGSRNVVGIADPVVDALIDLVITAPDRDSLIARTRALDRVLLWGHYVIPHFHSRSFRVAYWDKFGWPEIPPKYGFGVLTWWYDPARATAIDARRRSGDM